MRVEKERDEEGTVAYPDLGLCSVVSMNYSPMNCSPPGSSVHGTFRQEYWSVLPFLTPGNLPYPGIKPALLVIPALVGGLFTSAPLGL